MDLPKFPAPAQDTTYLGKLVLRVFRKAFEHLESEQTDTLELVLGSFSLETETSPTARFVDVFEMRGEPELVKLMIVVFGDRSRAGCLEILPQVCV